MFPYTMLATTAIFYSNDWPKKLFSATRIFFENPMKWGLQKNEDGSFYISKLSSHCIYNNDKLKEEKLI